MHPNQLKLDPINKAILSVFGFRISVILYCFEFRISDFEILFLIAAQMDTARRNEGRILLKLRII
jgi:hypothetical protein